MTNAELDMLNTIKSLLDLIEGIDGGENDSNPILVNARAVYHKYS